MPCACAFPSRCESGCSANWIGAGKTASTRCSLVEFAMQPAIPAPDQLWERVYICRSQFCHLTILENVIDDRMLGLERRQHAGISGISCLCLTFAGKTQLFEQYFAKLLSGIDVERVIGAFENFRLSPLNLAFQLSRESGQIRQVERDANLFHLGQNFA